MDHVFFLILRQMRGPLLLLSAVYAVATLGLTLIPGIDDNGNVRYLSLFHAFYFVSFMGTTIGFGEIPYPFSEGQRLWVMVFIYITVATWIFTLGALISLLSGDTLRAALTRYQFTRQVKQKKEPFAIVCGYGDTGGNLVAAMRRRQIHATVIDIRRERIDALLLDDSKIFVPGLGGDAGIPDNLVLAGLTHPDCRYVVALTNDNAVNLHVAITAKVMNPALCVICRTDSPVIEANMASFGTDHIIDPFDTFAQDLGLATYAPHQFLLSRWLRSEPDDPLPEVQMVPRGKWILCGFGRFGQAIYREMTAHGLSVQVIEPARDDVPEDTVIGDGTCEDILTRAGVENAVGIIAGTDDDSNNLSIVVTARQLNPGLFVIVRQNEHANKVIFEQSHADIAMEPSAVIAGKIRTILTNDTINQFLSLARAHEDRWARALSERIRRLGKGLLPETWEVIINEENTPAVVRELALGTEVRIGHLLRDYMGSTGMLPIIALFHANDRGAFCLPPIHTKISEGDRILLLGTRMARWKMKWCLGDEVILKYILTGRTAPRTLIGRWLERRPEVA